MFYFLFFFFRQSEHAVIGTEQNGRVCVHSRGSLEQYACVVLKAFIGKADRQ